MLIPHNLLKLVGGLLAASLSAQILLGWVLGVSDAWVTVSVAAALLGVLATADARMGEASEGADEPYDLLLCATAAVAIIIAVACLYLPLPWGGLAAATVVIGLVIALRLSRRRR